MSYDTHTRNGGGAGVVAGAGGLVGAAPLSRGGAGAGRLRRRRRRRAQGYDGGGDGAGNTHTRTHTRTHAHTHTHTQPHNHELGAMTGTYHTPLMHWAKHTSPGP
eukprot:COSAG01_NODE_46589_length_398_cov_43.090301_1_plen_104_part_01